jgi:hypothetical protein
MMEDMGQLLSEVGVGGGIMEKGKEERSKMLSIVSHELGAFGSSGYRTNT